MLPMLYAPLPGGEVPQREFTPVLPLPSQRDGWREAGAAAIEFWERAGNDVRISTPFESFAASMRNG